MSMMRKIAVLLLGVLIYQSVCAQVEVGHMRKYFYSIPYDIQPSELDINGNVRQVLYKYHHLEYGYGEMSVSSGAFLTLSCLPTMYEYNNKGHLITYKWYDAYIHSWLLEYDANGNVTEYGAEHIYENGKLTKCFWGGGYGARLFYNTNDELSKILLYDRDGTENNIVYYQNGDPIKRIFLEDKSTETYSYNNHKLIRSYSSDGNGDSERKYSYNEDGLVSRIVLYKKGKFCDRCDFVYKKKDAKGNWVMRLEIWKKENGELKVENGRCGLVTEREITYQ